MRWLNRYRIEVKEPESMMYADVPGIRICVHRIVGIAGWFLSCPTLRIDDVNLHTDDFYKATEQAKVVIREEVEKLETAVNKFLENLEN